jgi:hypothetical protein
VERRRPQKRANRISISHLKHLEEEYLFDEEDAGLVTASKK